MTTNGSGPVLRIGVLGPLKVHLDDEAIELGGDRQRRALVSLVEVGPGGGTADRLAEVIWTEDERPESAASQVRTLMSRLRSRFDDGESYIASRSGGGYRLADDFVDVDLWRFDELISSIRSHRPSEQLDEGTLAQVVDLVRGELYADIGDGDRVAAARARVEEANLSVAEQLIDLWLSDGDPVRAADRASELLERHPYRERLRALEVTALYRSGRQAEALRRLQHHRSVMIDDLGLDPSPELVELERRILEQDPGLEGRPPRAQGLRGYRILDELGRGAFAVVHRGVQPTLDRQVAIKVVRTEWANRPDFIRRFEAEAGLVAQLEHPHIVPLYDFWREPHRACLVFRYLRGGTLERAIVTGGSQTLDGCRRLAEQVGDALTTAHRSGIIHRDVKPANVLLDEEGNFYLGDFGIAIDDADRVDPILDLTVGSPAYASPEQLRRQAVGPQTDVHSFGITLFEAMTGRLPFTEARSAAELLERQLTDPIPAVTDFRGDVTAELDRVLATATAKEPADRYDSVRVFVEHYVAALDAASDPTDTRSPALPVGRRGTSTVLVQPAGNPYKGLAPFTEADAGQFFGREVAVDRLLETLAEPSGDGAVVAVVGPSGIGKSSLVRAGLMPRVRSGVIPGSDRWFTAAMVPRHEPYEQLAAALLSVAISPMSSVLDRLDEDHRGVARAVDRLLAELSEQTETDEHTTATDPVEIDAGYPELVLIIDQFEELFTLAPPEVARRLLDALVYAIEDPGCRLRLVITLRADFWDRPLRHAGFARLLDGSTVHLSSLGPDDLERAIVEPASRAGGTIEPGLVPQMIADVADQPMALPLLQFALTELWERGERGALTLAAYEEIGGLAGAIATEAEDLYTQLHENDRAIARRVFGALVMPGEGGPDTRRRALRSELGAEPRTSDLVDRFGSVRLLSFDRHPLSREPTVELAHEALLRSWPRLQEWIDEDRDRIRSMRHLAASAAAWDEGERDDADLYGGARLQSVEDWTLSTPLSDLDAEFVSASLAARDAAELARRHQVRRLRRVLAAVAIIATIAIVASSFALVQQGRADRAAELARRSEAAAVEAREDATDQAFRSDTLVLASAAERLAGTDPVLALQLAVAAVEREENSRTTEALFTAFNAEPRFDGVVTQLGFGCVVMHTALGTMAVADTSASAADGTRSISLSTLSDDGLGRTIAHVMPPMTSCAQPSPDASRLLGFTADGLATAGPAEGQRLTSSIEVAAASWSADGSAIASVGSVDGRWEARRHDPDTLGVTEFVPIRAREVRSVHMAEQIALVNTAPPYVVDFGMSTGWPLDHLAGFRVVDLSDDGRFAVGVDTSHISLFDVASGRRLWQTELTGGGGLSSGVHIDPTGQVVAAITALGVELFEVSTGDSLGPVIEVGEGQVVLADSETLYVLDENHRLLRFALRQETRIEQVISWTDGGAFSPDGTYAMTPSLMNSTSDHRGINLSTGDERSLPVGGMRPVGDGSYVGFDEATSEVVIVGDDDERRIDVSDDIPNELFSMRLPRVSHGQVVLMLADRSAPELSANHVLVLDLTSGDVIGSFPTPEAFLVDQLGPDELLLGRSNLPAQVVDLSGNVIVDLPIFEGGDVTGAALGPDGDIITGLSHGTIVRWSRTEGVTETFAAEHDTVIQLLPVDDGVIAQYTSGAITRWRWGSVEPDASIAAPGDFGGLAALAADDRVVVPRDDGAYAIPLGTPSMIAQACRLAGPEFNPIAWRAATGLPAPTIAPCETTAES